jgi:hypothetical protein
LGQRKAVIQRLFDTENVNLNFTRNGCSLLAHCIRWNRWSNIQILLGSPWLDINIQDNEDLLLLDVAILTIDDLILRQMGELRRTEANQETTLQTDLETDLETDFYLDSDDGREQVPYTACGWHDLTSVPQEPENDVALCKYLIDTLRRGGAEEHILQREAHQCCVALHPEFGYFGESGIQWTGHLKPVVKQSGNNDFEPRGSELKEMAADLDGAIYQYSANILVLSDIFLLVASPPIQLFTFIYLIICPAALIRVDLLIIKAGQRTFGVWPENLPKAQKWAGNPGVGGFELSNT